MYSPYDTKRAKVNITYDGDVICTHRMTPKEVDKFVLHMRRKGYEIDVTYESKRSNNGNP